MCLFLEKMRSWMNVFSFPLNSPFLKMERDLIFKNKKSHGIHLVSTKSKLWVKQFFSISFQHCSSVRKSPMIWIMIMRNTGCNLLLAQRSLSGKSSGEFSLSKQISQRTFSFYLSIILFFFPNIVLPFSGVWIKQCNPPPTTLTNLYK